MLAKDIIAQMPPSIREKAEAKAAKAGKTLEAFVQEQISVQLNDEALDSVSGGATDEPGIDWRIDYNPTRGDNQIDVVIPFRF